MPERAVSRWLTAPAPAARLAVLRVLTGVFAVGYLSVRVRPLLAMADTDFASAFEPVGVLWWLPGPLGPQLVRWLVVVTLALGIAYTLGVTFRLAGPCFAMSLLVVTTYRSSGGQLLWFENLLVLHVAIVGWARSADALTPWARDARPVDDDVRYGWPVGLAAMVTVATYVLAGVAKLRTSGTAWLDGESLRNHVAFSSARLRLLGGTPSPIVDPLLDHPGVFTPAAVVTIVIEVAAPICLVVRWTRWPWVVAVWCMHAAIAATMLVIFPYQLSLVALAPLFDLEHLRGRIPDRFVRRR